jgi:NTP pyrophosphatase (non-canonical NTP hydrolase)
MSLTVKQELYAITAEECAELGQVMMKFMRFGDGAWIGREAIVEEAGDVLCMLQLLAEHNIITWEELEQRSSNKREKLKTYSNVINED